MPSIFQKVIQGGALYTAGSISQKAFTAGFIVLFTQVLNLESFGALMLGITIMNLASLLALGGLCSASPKFLPKGRSDGDQYWGVISALGLLSLMTAAFTGSLFEIKLAGILGFRGSFGSVFAIALLGLPIQGLHRLCQTALQAQERPAVLLAVEIFHGILKIGLPFAFYSLTKTAEGALVGYASSFGFITLVSLAFIRTQNRATWPSNQWPIVRKILGFVGPSMVVGFSYVIAQQLDRLMVGAIGNEAQVGLYVVASTLAMTLTIVHTAFTQIFSPLASRISGSEGVNDLSEAYSISSRWASAASGVGIIIFAAVGPSILALFGPEYSTEPVYFALLILSVYYFSASILGPTTQLLQMRGAHGQEGVNALVFLIANVALNIALIPIIGFLGAALATLLSSLIRSGMQAFQIQKRYRLTILDANRVKLFVGVSLATGFIIIAHHQLLIASLIACPAIVWLGYEIIRQSTTHERELFNCITTKVGISLRS